LFIDQLNDFPGGLTQIFWDTVGADLVCTLYGKAPGSKVVARTRIGFCDGRRIHQFEGEIGGRIATEPRGSRAFQWDCVFVPEGSTRTFAEMGDAKDEISMRRKALDTFVEDLKRTRHA
jgi:XTP/dITP diphosphohydrolase